MGTTTANAGPQLDVSPAPEAAVSPNAFRGACVDLLCRLENKLDQISAAGTSGASFEKLETAKLMLVDLIDFAERNLQPEQVERLTPHLQEVFEKTKQLEEQLNKSSWGLVHRLVTQQKLSRFELDAAYEELSKEYVRLFVVFFVESMNAFSAPPAEKRGMLESVEAFVEEIRRRW